MTLLRPVVPRLHQALAQSMSFKSNKNVGSLPRQRRWFAAAAAALFLVSAGNASAQLMSIPANFGAGATGAAGYSVPIVVPPGTAGVAPSLSLDYSSQGGNGIVGMGWTLSGLVSITRCGQTIAQDGANVGVTYNWSDRFCLSGQRLVAINGNYGADGTEYRTEIESYNRVISHGTAGNGPAWFEVHTKSGQIMQFGNTPDSQIFALCTSTVRSWAVNKVSDTKGNYYNVYYDNDTGCGGNGQAFPSEIAYTGNAAAGTNPYNYVVFSYTSRTDAMPVFQAGSQIKTTVLLTDIRTYAGSSVVADYNLAYERGSATGRSRLTSVTLCVPDGSCLPATTFSWQEGGSGPGQPAPLASPVTFSSQNGFDSMGAGVGPGLLALDLNGDGKTDFVQQWNNGGCLALITYISNGDGTFTGRNFQPNPCQSFNSMGTQNNWSSLGGGGNFGPGLIALDLNGDGKGDLVQQWNNNGHVTLITYISNGDGTFQVGSFDCPWCGFDSMGTGLGPGLLALDLNGDGRSDLVQQWNNNGCLYLLPYINNGSGGFTVTIFHPNGCSGFNSMDPNQGPGLLPMDVNGDGKIDLVQQWNNNGVVSLIVYTSVGDGTFTGSVFTCSSCGFDSMGAGQGPGLIPLDLNGDGNIDLVQPWNANGCLYLVTYLNNGNGTFHVNGFNAVPNGCAGFDSTGAGQGPGLLPLDLNGDGKTDLVQPWNNNGTLWFIVYYSNGDGTFTPQGFSSGAPFEPAGHCVRGVSWAGICSPIGLVPVDLNGDGKSDLVQPFNNSGTLYFTSFLANPPFPDLLTSITTGLGARTAITYLPLTNPSVYTKDSSATYPTIDLIAPLYVASRVDASNGIGGTYSTTYSYAGAKSDLSGRGFLGFRQTVTTDLQTNVVQTTNFLQTYPFSGMTASQTKTLGSLTLNQTTNTFNATALDARRQQVFLSQTVEQSNDLDGTPILPITTTYRYDDGYNNPTQIVVSTPDGFSKTTNNIYANDIANWFFGRLTQAQVTATSPQASLTRTSSFAYDASTGLLTQEVIEPNIASLRLETDYSYDVFGNKTQVTVSGWDIATRSSTSTYDSAGQFATAQSNALNQSESWQYDPRFGKPISHTGPNGLTTTWQYDGYGRKTLEVRPDGTRTQFTHFSCAGGNCPCEPGSLYVIGSIDRSSSGTQIGTERYIHYDSLDREIYRMFRGFDGNFNESLTQYDSLGRVSQKSRPFVGGCAMPLTTPQVTTYSYDALSRVVTESLPDGNRIQHAYHGLLTSDTNQNNQTRTVTKNSQGQVVSVADAQGNVTRYYYDPFGNLVETIDTTGQNVVSATYDARGRKIATSDPDLGAWSYSYNTLNQLVSQTDAKGQTSQFTYDVLGRLIQRTEGDMTATWTYDTAPYGIGKLASAGATGPAAGTNPFQRAMSYDGLGRPSQVATTIDGATYTISGSYDANGRLSQVAYPSGLAVNYGYTSLGYVQQLSDASSGQIYWTANARDAEMHLTQDTAGNGVVTSRTFNAPTGRLTGIVAGSGNGVAYFGYFYDGVGNVLSRGDGNTGITESFTYDTLNRLTSSTLNLSPAPLVKNYAYDSIGNLLLKSDAGYYTYPAPGMPRPHGVVSIDGAISATFTYDANGNQTAAGGLGRTIGYNAANKPATITQGALTLNFADDVDHQRYKQTVMQGANVTTTRYLDAFGVHVELVTGATTQWNDYLMVGGSMVGVRFLQGTTVTLRYFHQDRLGSIAALTDASGNVVERDAYDAWGKRRFVNGTDDPTGSITSQTIQGFTGQEMLASVGLVHLNGRVYDPTIGRMTSADPMVPDPLNGQTWNRYSYVGNNPVAFTDPTGYCFLDLCNIFNGISTFFNRVFNGIEKFLQRNPIVGSVLKIIGAAITYAICAGVGPACFAAGAAITSGIVDGIASGSFDLALKSAAIAGLQALAFYGVGDITLGAGHTPAAFGSDAFFSNVLGHALVGCGITVLAGGKCGAGALAAAVPAFAGPVVNQLPFQGALVANSTLGGLASVAGGGKFANGAVTGAFGYLFNQAAHEGNDPNERHQMGVQAAMQDYIDRGYAVIRETPVAVEVPGFETPRYYDFIVNDPASGYNIGVEVKTTLYDTIRLDSSQVAKDVVVMEMGGYARLLDLPINGVGYQTYCWACDLVDFRSTVLYSTLQAANIPFNHGGRPGEILP
jgi:RHS repeat-associated protein